MVLELLFEFRFRLAAPPFAQLAGTALARARRPEPLTLSSVALRDPTWVRRVSGSISWVSRAKPTSGPPSGKLDHGRRDARHLPTGDKQFPTSSTSRVVAVR